VIWTRAVARERCTSQALGDSWLNMVLCWASRARITDARNDNALSSWGMGVVSHSSCFWWNRMASLLRFAVGRWGGMVWDILSTGLSPSLWFSPLRPNREKNKEGQRACRYDVVMLPPYRIKTSAAIVKLLSKIKQQSSLRSGISFNIRWSSWPVALVKTNKQ